MVTSFYESTREIDLFYRCPQGYGTIDCIASDHAPHSAGEKDCEFDKAPPGTTGLETTLGLVKTYVIDCDYLS